ncbi:MFS transporter [Pseudothauera nasutitermitis]|uniref:MFS transporter n=1 Tax=Pseudothauera nasutitermitis TaxID=2565930 RepID=A0A4V3WBE9_9RHOO|nr:MFS transporter [Pseudothauera nasutitermitis]THF62799.1 MFS transporter [Pseudothauera nasutitermitis]
MSPVPPAPSAEPAPLEAGTPAYQRANVALFIGGFATFAMLYGTQPILPLLSSEFGVGPARASLTVSLGTGALAAALIPASILSDRYGRARVMNTALALAALCALASAFVVGFDQLLVLRALLGLALAGLPAAAMAWLGEEISPSAQGRAMGLYIAGNALGGMSGRFIAALLTDFFSWRIALGLLGVLGAVAALAFWRWLPASRNFRARPATPRRVFADVLSIYRDPGLPWLFTVAFLIMGAFVGLYNYLGFRLQEAPYLLSQSAVGAVFLLYLLGTLASTWAGRLADRIGRRNVLWSLMPLMAAGLLLTLFEALPVVIIGVGIFTFAYFAVHTAASGWVGRRAQERRALGSALYLCSYYFGSSVLGALGGLAWSAGGWAGLVAMLTGCTVLALLTALWLRRLRPALD